MAWIDDYTPCLKMYWSPCCSSSTRISPRFIFLLFFFHVSYVCILFFVHFSLFFPSSCWRVTSVERVERKKSKRNRDQYNRRVVENPRNSCSTHTLRKMKVMVRINLVVSSHIEEEERRKFFLLLLLLSFSFIFFPLLLLCNSPFLHRWWGYSIPERNSSPLFADERRLL